MPSVLSTRGPEKQPSNLPSVMKAEINYVADSATVVYDETAIGIEVIKVRVHECGCHFAGEHVAQRGSIANAVSRTLLAKLAS